MAAILTSVNDGVYITNAATPVPFKGSGFGAVLGRCGVEVAGVQYEFTVNSWTDALVMATPPISLPAGAWRKAWLVVAGDDVPLTSLVEGDGGILTERGSATQIEISNPNELTEGGLYSVKLTSGVPGAKPGNGMSELVPTYGELLLIPGVTGVEPGDATYLFRSSRTRNLYSHRPGEWVGGIEANGPLWTLIYGNNNTPQVKLDIGEGSMTNSGTLKLTNSVASTSGTDGGIAATPAAVKQAYDYTTSQIASTVKLGGNQFIAGVKNFAVSPELDGVTMFSTATWTPALGTQYGFTLTPGGGATYEGNIETMLNTVHVDFTVDFAAPATTPSVGDTFILTGLSAPLPAAITGMRGAGSAWLAWQSDAVSDGEFAIFDVAIEDTGGVYLTCMQVKGPINFAARLAGHLTYRKA